MKNATSRSRIDQDEFEIQGTWLEKSNFEKSNFEKSNRATKISTTNSNRNSRSRIEQDNENFDDKFETKIQGTWIRHSNRKSKFEKSNLTIDFEKSNRATKRKRRIRNSTRKFKELELETRNSRNRIEQRNEKDDFKIRLREFEKSNSRIEFKTRHENFGISHETQRKQKSFATNDRRTTRSSLTRNAHMLARNSTRTHTRDTHFKWAVVLIK